MQSSLRLVVSATLPNVDDAVRRSIHGIIGIIHLISGPYLIVITSKVRVGDINGQAIYKVQTTDIIPYARNLSHLNEYQVNESARPKIDCISARCFQLKYNNKYLAMIELVLRTEAFYFSYTYDITHTFQRLQTSSPDFHSIPYIERADQRFVWNRYLLSQFTSNRATARFALPLVHGCTLKTFTRTCHTFVFHCSRGLALIQHQRTIVHLRCHLSQKYLPCRNEVRCAVATKDGVCR